MLLAIYEVSFILLSLLACLACLVIPRCRQRALKVLVASVAFGILSLLAALLVALLTHQGVLSLGIGLCAGIGGAYLSVASVKYTENRLAISGRQKSLILLIPIGLITFGLGCVTLLGMAGVHWTLRPPMTHSSTR